MVIIAIVVTCLLALTVFYLMSLYNGKVIDKNKNYVPDVVEKKYWLFDSYVKRVIKAIKYLYNIILNKDVS